MQPAVVDGLALVHLKRALSSRYAVFSEGLFLIANLLHREYGDPVSGVDGRLFGA